MKVEDYAGGNRTKLIDYTYDPLGNLVKRVEDSTTTTTYVQDINSGLPYILIATTGNIVEKFTRGSDLLKVNRSGDGVQAQNGDFYYYTDGLGSIRTITKTDGTIICRYIYDVYGKPLASETNETQTWNVFKFTGEYYDDDIELVYLRARWYDPSTGRFMTRDTQAARDYKYCYNDPVNRIDPTGYKGKNVVILIGTDFGYDEETGVKLGRNTAFRNNADRIQKIHESKGDTVMRVQPWKWKLPDSKDEYAPGIHEDGWKNPDSYWELTYTVKDTGWWFWHRTATENLMTIIGNQFGKDGIDYLYIETHVSYYNICVTPTLKIGVDCDWSPVKFNKDAEIIMDGCYGGYSGKKNGYMKPQAQVIANKTKCKVRSWVYGSINRPAPGGGTWQISEDGTPMKTFYPEKDKPKLQTQSVYNLWPSFVFLALPIW